MRAKRGPAHIDPLPLSLSSWKVIPAAADSSLGAFFVTSSSTDLGTQGWIKSRLSDIFRPDSFKTQIVSEIFTCDNFGPNRCGKYVMKLWWWGNKSARTHSWVSFILKAQCELMILFNIAWKIFTYVSENFDWQFKENFDRQFWRFSGWSGQTVSEYTDLRIDSFNFFQLR